MFKVALLSRWHVHSHRSDQRYVKELLKQPDCTVTCVWDEDEQVVDNTTEPQVSAWLEALKTISPQSVMVYSIARDTPCKALQKVEREELEKIAERVRALGIACSVA